MDQKMLELIGKQTEEIVSKQLENVEANVTEAAIKAASEAALKTAEKFAAERAAYGHDTTGLTEEQKMSFADLARSVNGMVVKASEELTTATDARGGYLVPTEVADAILRVAASTGIIAKQARQWPMGSEQLDVPNYSGAVLEGSFLAVDGNDDRVAASLQALAFGSASLVAKDWILPFAVTKSLLRSSSVALADFLVALAGEAFANMVDKQALVGTGSPFTGVLSVSGTTAVTLTTGNTTFAKIADETEKLHEAVIAIDESIRSACGFYMNSTVWHTIATKKDGNGRYLVNLEAQNGDIIRYAQQTGLTPAGFLWGYPVFTNRNMPSTAAGTQTNTKFAAFGDARAIAYGLRDGFTLNTYQSGSFGGKELALTGRVGFVFEAAPAVVVALPAAFAVIKTAAS